MNDRDCISGFEPATTRGNGQPTHHDSPEYHLTPPLLRQNPPHLTFTVEKPPSPGIDLAQQMTSRRISGIRKTTFWLSFALVLAVLVAAVLGGVLGGLLSIQKKDNMSQRCGKRL